MSRSFDGFGDDSISLSPGNLASLTAGPISVAVLHRPASGFCGLFHGEKATASQFEIWGESGSYFVIPGGFSQGPAFSSNIWQLTGYSKANGTVKPRYHYVELEGGSAGTWTHQDGSTTVADWAGPIDLLKIGHGSVRKANGLIAAIAVWNQTFNDAGWVSLGYTSAQSWFAANPVGMWLLNQASTSTPVADVTGGGANQTATTNPAVSANDPPGWSYALTTYAKGGAFLPFF